jgi:hypothetical protein
MLALLETKVCFLHPVSGKKVYEEPEYLSPLVPGRLYNFVLIRVEAGAEAYTNQMTDCEFFDYCRRFGRMRLAK